jgi:hypothetical protein
MPTKKVAKKKAAKKVAAKKVAKKKAAKKKRSGRSAACSQTKRARTVLKHARESVDSFFTTYDLARQERGAGQSAPTNTEQDLTRAALVFAAAGLDSAIKELIRGSLRKLAKSDEDVQDGIQSFVKSRLRKDQDAGGDANNRFLARLLMSPEASDVLIDEYVLFLTGSSLQSANELDKAAKALDVDVTDLKQERNEIKDAFDIRNKIIHELDVRFGAGQGQRKRNSRRKNDLEAKANLLLDVGESFITAVEKKLK